jgi:hypothetical protein
VLWWLGSHWFKVCFDNNLRFFDAPEPANGFHGGVPVEIMKSIGENRRTGNIMIETQPWRAGQ